jgi:hypothetical protein
LHHSRAWCHPGPSRYNYCEDYGVYSVCSKANGEEHFVETRNGTYQFQNNGKYEYSVSINGVFWYSEQSSVNYSYVFSKGEFHENLYHSSGDFTQDGRTCTYSYAYHLANGQVQFDNTGFSCAPA